jgi:molybdopterin converting factor small subunit
MKILFFGVLADVTGKSMIEMEADDLDSLKRNLSVKFPELNQYRFQWAVNREKVEKNKWLNSSDEIALLPPFAGG